MWDDEMNNQPCGWVIIQMAMGECLVYGSLLVDSVIKLATLAYVFAIDDDSTINIVLVLLLLLFIRMYWQKRPLYGVVIDNSDILIMMCLFRVINFSFLVSCCSFRLIFIVSFIRGLVWHSGNSIDCLPSWCLSRPTQPGHPSVDRRTEHWQWLRQLLGRNGKFCVAAGPVARTAGILYASLIGSNASGSNGMSCLPTDVLGLCLILLLLWFAGLHCFLGKYRPLSCIWGAVEGRRGR